MSLLRPEQQSGGASTVLTVLVAAALVLVTMVVSTTLAVQSMTRVRDDSVGYSNLQVAESGQDTFYARAVKANSFPTLRLSVLKTVARTESEARPRAVIDASSRLSTWLQTAGLRTFATSQGNATLSVASVSVRLVKETPSSFDYVLSTFDLLSAANVQQGGAKVRQTYSSAPRSLGLPPMPAALTSAPSVRASGSASVAGMSTAAYPDALKLPRPLTLSEAATLRSGVQSVLRTVDSDLSLLKPNDYVHITVGTQKAVARVDSVAEGVLKVTPSPTFFPSGVNALTLSANTPLDARVAVAAVQAYNSATKFLQLSHPEAYLPGDSVSVQVGSTSYSGTLGTKTTSGGVVGWTVNWSGQGPSSTAIPAGTTLRRRVHSVSSSGSLGGSGNISLTPSYEESAPNTRLANPSNEGLFKQIFGLDSATFYGSVPKIPSSNFNGQVDGLVVLEGNANLNNEKLCGSGILIVEGNLNINQNQNASCPEGFRGMIYVKGGSASVRGNLELLGGIVVEGNMSFEGTSIAGTGRKVTFDPNVLYEQLNLNAPHLLKVQSGSWRQQ